MTEKSAVETKSTIEIIAKEAGWDNSRLLLLISRRLNETGRAEDVNYPFPKGSGLEDRKIDKPG